MKTLEHAVPTPSDLPVYLKLTMVTMIWGGTFVAGRILSGALAPLLAASLRFLLASIALLLFLALARIPLVRPTLKQGLLLAGLGFFGIFFYNLCFFYGLQYINASRASLIVALNPAVIGLASWWLFKERLSALKVVGIGLCIGGAGLVIVSRDPALLQDSARSWIGDVLIFGCVLGWGIYSLFSKGLNEQLGPLQTVTWSILLGTLMLWLACAVGGEVRLEALRGLDLKQWLSLLYLGVLGSALAYIAWYDGIRRIGATRSGVFIALNPLTAVLLGALLLDERFTALMRLGGGLILVGIFLCNRPLARTRRKTI
ncbi:MULTISPECIES: DMT family transporter [Pseudomonas]|uniref:DMT family transporter n=1 Tax=Pseudomonas TaxID=286 RepID=UPI001BEBB91D|nr:MULTISPECIES: DMT family transporter [Pseudomonas]MBT2341339.1 DMT family transporter [Pseudomonas fluorescens]MCD4529685.1 DMT family transporter [Pseudomonas sp. C3-2018]